MLTGAVGTPRFVASASLTCAARLARPRLDVGCGTGASTPGAGRRGRVRGARAVVGGADDFRVSTSRGRASARPGSTGVALVLADAQTHAFEPAGFDLAVSRFGMMFFADPVAAFANILAAMRRGGRLVFAAWAPVDANRVVHQRRGRRRCPTAARGRCPRSGPAGGARPPLAAAGLIPPGAGSDAASACGAPGASALRSRGGGDARHSPKRAYEPASPDDGTRVLVERLWPRGVSRPPPPSPPGTVTSPESRLRKWYAHDPARWEEFRARYRSELEGHAPGLERLRALARSGPLTLVFAARDPERSSAAVLRESCCGAFTPR